jgi:hypothetical protein
MKTTVTLDRDIAAGREAEARRTGRALEEVVNECLRTGLLWREASRSASPFAVRRRDFGTLKPGISLDNVAELLEQSEGPDRACSSRMSGSSACARKA